MERAISDPEKTFSNDKHEPRFLRIEEASKRSTINMSKMSYLLTWKISQKQAPIRAFGKQSGTSSDNAQCKGDRGKEMHWWNSCLVKTKLFPRSHHSSGQKEMKVKAPPGCKKRNVNPSHWAPLGEAGGILDPWGLTYIRWRKDATAKQDVWCNSAQDNHTPGTDAKARHAPLRLDILCLSIYVIPFILKN